MQVQGMLRAVPLDVQGGKPHRTRAVRGRPARCLRSSPEGAALDATTGTVFNPN